jgi:serpin B
MESSYLSGFVPRFRFLDVNELGTEAAATTMMLSFGYREPPPPVLMVVDRPFFLAIRDQLSGVLLFTGSVLEP